MAGYLPFKKEAPKRLVLRNNVPGATTVFIENVVDVEIEDSAIIIASAIEDVDDTLESLNMLKMILVRNLLFLDVKKKSRIILLFFLLCSRS